MKQIADPKEFHEITKEIRLDIMRMLGAAKSGHPGGSLGMVEVFTALYFNVLNHNPKKPDWSERDYLLLSNGHICPVLYATMANAGYFPKEELLTLRKLGSRIQGHPHREVLPGLETTSGPLGSGISQAAGMAAGLKMDGKKNHVYCITSDGEHDEGNTWEGVMFANKYKLDNLTCIMDYNGIQLSGDVKDIMPFDHVKEKYESFGWKVLEVDGHDIPMLIKALKTRADRPIMVVAKTIPGKGVTYMEGKFEWHGKVPSGDLYNQAIQELENT